MTGGYLSGGYLSGGYLSGRYLSGGICPDTHNNILFYSANIQFNKNLFSALYKKKMCSTSVDKNMQLKNNIHNNNKHIKTCIIQTLISYSTL